VKNLRCEFDILDCNFFNLLIRHLMMHMEIFHVKCFQMQLFCGTCCRGESQHGLMTELNEQEPIKCLIADAEMEDDAEIPEEIVTISSKTAKPLELSHALNGKTLTSILVRNNEGIVANNVAFNCIKLWYVF